MAAVLGRSAQKHMLGFSPLCFEKNLFTRIFWHPSENAAMCLLRWWADVRVLFYFVLGQVVQKWILISENNADGCCILKTKKRERGLAAAVLSIILYIIIYN